MLEYSIVTPSYNMLSFLKMCAASIADQKDASKEHIVIDGLSTDGTVEWLKNNPNIRNISQKDKGMYDAINKGFQLARGNILAYLNCDEQYLPGTLSIVKKIFDKHPDVKVVFGNTLIVRPDGSLISYRKAYKPRLSYILSSHLYLFSCSMFFQRIVFDDGFSFNDHLKYIGDMDLIIRLLRNGYKFSYCNRYLGAFTMTGKNMHAKKNALLEKRQTLKESPAWVRALRFPLNMARLTEKLLSGAYWQKMPLNYYIYGLDDVVKRKNFRAEKASFRWQPY